MTQDAGSQLPQEVHSQKPTMSNIIESSMIKEEQEKDMASMMERMEQKVDAMKNKHKEEADKKFEHVNN